MVKYENDLRRLAYHDVLTGLANRELMQRELAESIAQGEARGQAVWLLMIDLDRFKYVNDTLGHHVGDHLLKIVSERLRATVRETDIVARLGGDEFVIILRSPDSLDEGVVQRIMDHLSGPIELDGNDYVLTSSIGIAVYPRDGRDSDTLLKNADIAMYRAKNAGRNNFHFYEPEIPKVSMNRIRMEAALRTALEQGQFELHYQPQVALATREIVGMEALLRWHHPEHGLIPPGDFLHIAEETGIIVAIGEWVMRTACRQTRAWQQAGLGQLRVAVNLSHRHFHRPELVDTVADCLRTTGLAPACLDQELTEGIIMREVEHAIAKMDALKALGVQLSVDDFGTGYSSLAHLTRFPVDVLKVDRSFVQDIESDPQQAAITRSIISLARNLDLEVIAEGVENAAQLDYLVGYGCDQVQGYYFSRPVPARQFETLLREWKPALPMCA
jgi:diguanylate cyclase (GGDEF)-like protein